MWLIPNTINSHSIFKDPSTLGLLGYVISLSYVFFSLMWKKCGYSLKLWKYDVTKYHQQQSINRSIINDKWPFRLNKVSDAP